MINIMMRGAATAAVLGWAMLAGAANATVVTYNFSAPISYYYDNINGNLPGGTFAGSVSIDTAKLAQGSTYNNNSGIYGYTYTYSSNPGLAPVIITPAVSGTAGDAFANSPLAQQPTNGGSQLFQGTGNYYLNYGGGSYFSLYFAQDFNSEIFGNDDTVTNTYDHQQFGVDFFGAGTTTIDGYVLPTPGTGTISAYLDRSRGYYQYTANYGEYLGGSQEYVNLQGQGGTTTAGEGPADVPEPGALALLGLGMLGLAVRRRRRAA